MFKRIKILLSIALFISPMMITAQSRVANSRERLILENSHFVENYEIRQNLRDLISNSQFNSIDMSARIYTQEAIANRIRVSLLRTDEAFFIIFANEILHAQEIQRNAQRRFNESEDLTNSYDLMLSDRFQINGRGSYIIKKRLVDGTVEHIKIYLQSDSESYILITPINSNESHLDVYLFGTPVYRNVRLPMSFITVATVPLANVMSATSALIDWNLIFASIQDNSAIWRSVEQIIRQVHLRLPEVRHTDDGAQNSDGQFVYIRNQAAQSGAGGFNRAGFTKWIIDGFFAPLNQGQLLDISALTAPTPRMRGVESVSTTNSAESNFFHLDWNRNLAYRITRTIFPRHRVRVQDSDVTDTPFLSYVPDVGYSLASLPTALYLETIRDPGSIFLGSISVLTQSTPVTRSHISSIIMMPYFDSFGNFQLVIFEDGKVRSHEELHAIYGGAFVHLQRIKLNDTRFTLPKIQ